MAVERLAAIAYAVGAVPLSCCRQPREDAVHGGGADDRLVGHVEVAPGGG